jgi:hypothetical protein
LNVWPKLLEPPPSDALDPDPGRASLARTVAGPDPGGFDKLDPARSTGGWGRSGVEAGLADELPVEI